MEVISIVLYVNVHFLYFKYSINKKNSIFKKIINKIRIQLNLQGADNFWVRFILLQMQVYVASVQVYR